jgi:UDP-N-acetyl-D-mannosaminuronic acid dehydrogenase
MDIVRRLQKENVGELLICEPNLKSHSELELVSLQTVMRDADIILLLVDHKSFKRITASDLKEKVVIDTRGIIR